MLPEDERSESSVPPPPPPPSGVQGPPIEYQKAVKTVNEVGQKALPTMGELESRKIEYETNYAVVEEGSSPEALATLCVKYGYAQSPLFHKLVRHKQARSGYLYDWHVSPGSGVLITRDINKDTAVEKLSLSDIIYFFITRDSDLKGMKLTKIMQYNVASGFTDPILRYIGLKDLPKRFTPKDGAHFSALLGSVNLRSAMYLVRDYGKQLGITGIKSITILNFPYDRDGEKEKTLTGLSLEFDRV